MMMGSAYHTYKLLIILRRYIIKCFMLFCLFGPAFGDSDDEDMHLNDALRENMDDVDGNCPDEAGTFTITYCITNLDYLVYLCLLILLRIILVFLFIYGFQLFLQSYQGLYLYQTLHHHLTW